MIRKLTGIQRVRKTEPMTPEEVDRLPDIPPGLGSLDDIDFMTMLEELRLVRTPLR